MYSLNQQTLESTNDCNGHNVEQNSNYHLQKNCPTIVKQQSFSPTNSTIEQSSAFHLLPIVHTNINTASNYLPKTLIQLPIRKKYTKFCSIWCR